MGYYIGIDLGTSSVKLLLTDEKGKILSSVSKTYPIMFPHDGWSEQNPGDWWDAVKECLPKLIKDIDKNEIRGIGCGGQMHGLVALDENDKVIRPAILWNDGRTDKETDYLNNDIGKETLSALTGNIAFAGFTAPKILWMKKNEPENFARIKKIMLPKDYINFMLTGVHSCDYSDASGMLLLDVKNKCWSGKMLSICGIDISVMPKLYESYEVIGSVSADIGLPHTVKVVAGAGDNAAAAVGTGTVGNGGCNISLGTSGTIFISSEKFGVDRFNSLHAFAHADGGYHLMGCMLSAASCNKWFYESILQTDDYDGLQNSIDEQMLGENKVYFLPYLMGERSPINDTDARGAFIGMSMDTTRTAMVQAVLEGVAFAVRDSFEVAKSLGIDIKRSCICGGGAKSETWCRIIADVLNIDIELPVTEEGPGFGGAMLAMVGCGEYKTVKECCGAICKTKRVIKPDEILAKKYQLKYEKFKEIYPSLKNLYKKLKENQYV